MSYPLCGQFPASTNHPLPARPVHPSSFILHPSPFLPPVLRQITKRTQFRHKPIYHRILRHSPKLNHDNLSSAIFYTNASARFPEPWTPNPEPFC